MEKHLITQAQRFDFSAIDIGQANKVPVSPEDLHIALDKILSDSGEWPKLIQAEKAPTERIMAYIADWLQSVAKADAEKAHSPIEKALYRFLGPGDDFMLIATAIICRASAFLRFLFAHFHDQSYFRPKKPDFSVESRLIMPYLNRLEFRHAACLTPVELIDEKPGFDLAAFVDNLNLVRKLRRAED
jgi:hypothetical protein